MSRRVLSVILSVILIITMMPFTSYAASTSKSIFSAVKKGKSVKPKTYTHSDIVDGLMDVLRKQEDTKRQ